MQIKKRDGSLEPVDFNKILKAITRFSETIPDIDPVKIAQKIVNGVYDGISTHQIDHLAVQTAASLIADDPNYSQLAARLLAKCIEKEANSNKNGIYSFSQSMQIAHELGLINDRLIQFVKKHSRKLNDAIKYDRNELFEYFGLKTLYDRYLLKHPFTRLVVETPQYLFMRVACSISINVKEAIEYYHMFSLFEYIPSTPTLFNAGTIHEQLSSCYLLDSPLDSLESIYDRYKQMALLSKYSGGLGISYSKVRSSGSLIKGTNGASNGIIPFLKTLDASVLAVNQCLDGDVGVYTKDGVKSIKNICVGDLVLGKSGKYKRVEEIFVYENSSESLLDIRTRFGVDSIKLTKNHPIFALQGIPLGETTNKIIKNLDKNIPKWIDAVDLKEGDFIGFPIPSEIQKPENFDSEDAFFYGLMLGDGHICRNRNEGGISFNLTTKKYLVDFVREYLTKKGIVFWEAFQNNCLSIKFSISSRLPFNRQDLYEENGQKCIHSRFLHLPLFLSLEILCGLIRTDGNISRGKEITFFSSSKCLIDGVIYQLLRFGVNVNGKAKTIKPENISRIIEREDGSTSTIFHRKKSFVLRIPAFEELAHRLIIPARTKSHEVCWNNFLFVRVKHIENIHEKPLKIYDLVVDTDESYTTSGGLVHNGGRRKGAAAVYLETWHADIEEFLELRNNTGDEARRTYNLNLAHWIPDLFMKRVEEDGIWSLFDPAIVPQLSDKYGNDFDITYLECESQLKFVRQVKARDLYGKMMRTLAQTGNGWICFKDAANQKSNQTLLENSIIHNSNLCSEIVEVTDDKEIAVCNLGSINLSKYILKNNEFDWKKLAKNVRLAIRQLDQVIDLNFYPISEAKKSNMKWRPVGLGIMGLQDVFFQNHFPFDSEPAKNLSKKIQQFVYFEALKASNELAVEKGAHLSFKDTRSSLGILQFDLWSLSSQELDVDLDWVKLKEKIIQYGLRNSLLIAIAPTATIASIVGCYECMEPQISNLFKRESLSGDFLQINKYLVEDLKKENLWNDSIKHQLRMGNGSIQHISEISLDLKQVYRTVWEIPMRSLIDMAADRGAFIDQSQSLNLFIENPNIGTMSSMYMYAWKRGLKTTYYLRSRPATQIAKVNVAQSLPIDTTQAIACSLENPETCESCQ